MFETEDTVYDYSKGVKFYKNYVQRELKGIELPAREALQINESLLNFNQKIVYYLIKRQKQEMDDGLNPEPLLMIIHGTAGKLLGGCFEDIHSDIRIILIYTWAIIRNG